MNGRFRSCTSTLYWPRPSRTSSASASSARCCRSRSRISSRASSREDHPGGGAVDHLEDVEAVVGRHDPAHLAGPQREDHVREGRRQVVARQLALVAAGRGARVAREPPRDLAEVAAGRDLLAGRSRRPCGPRSGSAAAAPAPGGRTRRGAPRSSGRPPPRAGPRGGRRAAGRRSPPASRRPRRVSACGRPPAAPAPARPGTGRRAGSGRRSPSTSESPTVRARYFSNSL